MRLRNLLAATLLVVVASLPALGLAQDRFHVDKDHFKVGTRKTAIHPRRLAVNQKGGRRQIRVLSHKQRHVVRKNVRGVTHHATTPHHPNHR